MSDEDEDQKIDGTMRRLWATLETVHPLIDGHDAACRCRPCAARHAAMDLLLRLDVLRRITKHRTTKESAR